MSRMQSLHKFLFQLDVQDLILFVLDIIGLTLIINAINRTSKFITKKFPHKRMLIFSWIPIFNFLFYFTGIIVIAFFLFQPGKEIAISFFVSILIAIGFAVKDPV